MGLLILRSSAVAAEEPSEAITGLDWDGTFPGRRMLFWDDPPAMYPMTYIWKIFQRQQVEDDEERYYTTFFWGNNGEFEWGPPNGLPMGNTQSYYGCHPYPVPKPLGDGKWEISVYGQDFVTRDDASEPDMVPDEWYSQGFVASRASSTVTNHKFYIDLPSVASADTISVEVDNVLWNNEDPPEPCICVGQAPDPWGHQPRSEEQNAIIRGLQFYDSALSQAHIVALGALETNQDVLDYCSNNSITSLWYLNMNPTPSDVTDKSGNGNHPSWDGAERPDLWEE